MLDPIVVLISSYKEGSLVQGAIRTALEVTNNVIVFEGPTEDVVIENADVTDTGGWQLQGIGVWETETSKRNHMLEHARKMMNHSFWIVTLDADEIIVWGEHLQDWLGILKPGYPGEENIVSMKRTEPHLAIINGEERDFLWTDICPSRCVHSSIVKRYDVGCWRIETPAGTFGTLDNRQSEFPPMFGEPHIHHRHYMRRPERKVLRLSQGEEKRWREEHGIAREKNNDD